MRWYNARRTPKSPFYSPLMLPELQLNDIVRLRKQHPCGSFNWKVVRLGADIGLVCEGCGRRMLLSRRKLGRRLKNIVTSSEDNLQTGA